MGRMGKEKGKRGEREIVKLLQPVADKVCSSLGVEPIKVERNLMQTLKGGRDLRGVEWMAAEVKYREQFSLGVWWKQTLKQAINGKEPVLFYRRNRVPWRVRMLMHTPYTQHWPFLVDISIEDFLVYFEFRLKASLCVPKPV